MISWRSPPNEKCNIVFMTGDGQVTRWRLPEFSTLVMLRPDASTVVELMPGKFNSDRGNRDLNADRS